MKKFKLAGLQLLAALVLCLAVLPVAAEVTDDGHTYEYIPIDSSLIPQDRKPIVSTPLIFQYPGATSITVAFDQQSEITSGESLIVFNANLQLNSLFVDSSVAGSTVTIIGERFMAYIQDPQYNGTQSNVGIASITVNKAQHIYENDHCTICGMRDPEVPIAGTCGQQLTWALNDRTGVLTISGQGDMTDYEYGKAPWTEFSADIRAVVIEEGVTSIGTNAFLKIELLYNAYLPDSLTTIKSYAFSDDNWLEYIEIPAGVTVIEENAFHGCSYLELEVDENNSCFCTDDSGVLYSKDMTTLLKAPGYLAGSYHIPATVTKIHEYAFYYCDDLTYISTPAENPNYSTDSSGVLYNKNKTTLIKAPGGLADSYTIPDAVTEIAPAAFDYCYNLAEITIPAGVLSIGDGAFSYCYKLQSITFTGSAPTLGEAVFHKVTATVNYPFADDSWSEVVTQNHSGTLTWVSYKATKGICGAGVGWEYDTAAKALTVSRQAATRTASQGTMTAAPWLALYADELRSVVIEEGVLNITEGAFAGCSSLETVTIPQSVRTIDGNAFAGCVRLKSVTFAGSAPTVHETAFADTDTTVYIPANDPTWNQQAKENIGNTFKSVDAFDIDVARMILGNSLEFQFGVAKDKLTDLSGVYAVIEKSWADGSTTTLTIPADQWGTAGGYYAIVYNGLAAKEMADTFNVTIYNAAGVAISDAKTDSVRAYVARAFDSQSDAGKTMLVDMLNYGAAAQLNFGYNTEDLANNQLTDQQRSMATAGTPEMSNDLQKGQYYTGSRFVLESRIQVQIGFSGLTEDMYAIYTYTNNYGQPRSVRVEGKDFLIIGGKPAGVELSELVYADARTAVQITVYNADGTVHGTATDSIESCALRSGGDVFVALMKFADSAKTYLYG